MPATVRLLATPRWVGWTLLALVAVVVCGGMAYWQLLRGESPTGSLLNFGYALQWPLFGVFFAALWWRMLRAEARALDAVVAQEEPPGADGGGGPSPFTPRPAGVRVADAAAAPGSARAEYNAMLADLARQEEGRTP